GKACDRVSPGPRRLEDRVAGPGEGIDQVLDRWRLVPAEVLGRGDVHPPHRRLRIEDGVRSTRAVRLLRAERQARPFLALLLALDGFEDGLTARILRTGAHRESSFSIACTPASFRAPTSLFIRARPSSA